MPDGCARVLVPSFANGAAADDQNLIPWRWGPDPPHKVMTYGSTGSRQRTSFFRRRRAMMIRDQSTDSVAGNPG